MKSRIRLQRRNQYGITTLQLSGPDLEVEIKMLSTPSKSERRAIARGFLSHIRPWLHRFSHAALDHSNHGMCINQRVKERGFRSLGVQPFQTEGGSLGFEIRMKRLNLGLSQAELSQLAGIRRTHLSEIERGRHLPKRRIRTALERVLGIPLTMNDEPSEVGKKIRMALS